MKNIWEDRVAMKQKLPVGCRAILNLPHIDPLNMWLDGQEVQVTGYDHYAPMVEFFLISDPRHMKDRIIQAHYDTLTRVNRGKI